MARIRQLLDNFRENQFPDMIYIKEECATSSRQSIINKKKAMQKFATKMRILA